MKRILLISALLLAVIFTVSADRRRMMMTRNATAAVSYIIDEGFEEVDTAGALGSGTDGYDSSLVTAETGTPNNDYATSPAPLTGSYSLLLDPSATDQQVRWTLSSGVTNCGVYFDYYDANLPSDANQPILEISDSGGNALCYVYSRTTGALQVFHNGTSATTTDTISATMTNRIWVDFNTNGVRLSFSYDTTKPASGNKVAAATNATASASAIRIQLRSVFGSGNASIFDNLKVGSNPVGSNP